MRLLHIILALATLLAAGASPTAQESGEALPTVAQHADPTYPMIARQMRIQGDVRVRITTDGESVRDAAAESGPAMLQKAAEENARTWKFAPHTPGTFHVTFRYKLMSGLEVEFLESPAVIEIMDATPQTMNINWTWVDFGKWKAQLKSAHGASSQVFALRNSGPDGEWLDGNVLSPKGESDEIDYGHKEGDYLAFTIKLIQPDGQHVKTFLVGKVSGDRIVGTFVDAAGMTGKWTAVRQR
jgi:TonB family protein